MRQRPLAAALLLLALLPTGPALATPPVPAVVAAEARAPALRALTVDDIFRLGEVGEPRLSPDGAWIAYTVTAMDLESDEMRTRLWMVPTAGGEPLAASAGGGSARRPRWSPDGRYLSFLSARDGDEAQVWALDRRGGEASALTAVPQGVSAYEWSPDGRRLVLVIHDPDPRKAAAGGGNGETGEEGGDGEGGGCDCEGEGNGGGETPPPWVIDRLQFKEDGVGYLDRRRDHLWLLDLDRGGAPVQLTAGDYDDSQPAFSPDGRWIVFVSGRGEEPDATYDTDLWLVSAADPERPLRRLTDHPGADDSPAWSPDGRSIAYLAIPEPQWLDYAASELAVIAVDGGAPRPLVRDAALYAPRFAADGRSVLFLIEQRGALPLARVAVDDAERERRGVELLVAGERAVYAFDPGPGGAVALTAAEPQRPAEVHLWRSPRDGEVPGALERLTRTNDRALEGVELGAVESFETASPDGTAIQGFLVRPPAAAQSPPPHPAILWIHGGPQAQHDWAFDHEAQLFAARGYLVVLPNPRGSTGRGQEFTLGIWRRWGEPDYDDVIAAVDHAIALGLADPERLGVGGWSYGGMLTNHVITRTGRFKAAISGASATLYAANYGHDIYQRWWEGELGLPWEPESRELWERLSPFYRLDRVTTPTLILCGEDDWNVPVLNSEQLYLALRRIGKAETLLVVYPGQAHTLTVPSYEKDRLERYLDWFGRFLKTPSPAAASTAAAAPSRCPRTGRPGRAPGFRSTAASRR